MTPRALLTLTVSLLVALAAACGSNAKPATSAREIVAPPAARDRCNSRRSPTASVRWRPD